MRPGAAGLGAAAMTRRAGAGQGGFRSGSDPRETLATLGASSSFPTGNAHVSRYSVVDYWLCCGEACGRGCSPSGGLCERPSCGAFCWASGKGGRGSVSGCHLHTSMV